MKRRYLYSIVLGLICLLGGAIFCACDENNETDSETHTHRFYYVETVQEPDCLHAGSVLEKCDCGEVRTSERAAHGHYFLRNEVTKEPTCTEDGIKTYYCAYCDATQEAVIEKSHHFVTVPKKEPTCIKAGYTEHRKCSRCGEKDSKYRELPALGHEPDFGGHSYPTCTKWGWANRCSRCYQIINEKIPPLGHDFGEWTPYRAADCLNAGTERRTCKRCKTAYEERLASPMTEHEFHNGSCTVCGRRDWAHLEINDPDLYSGDYAFYGLAALERGAQMQMLYRAIEADARDFHVSGESLSALELGEYDYDALGLAFDDVVTVWKAFMDDHPLYYWLSRTLLSGDTAIIKIDETYAEPSARAELNALIYDTARRWREESSENAYLAALCYHDKILDAVDYVYGESGEPSTALWAHNIIGVFQEKGAVCEGYARSFQLLLNASGIENIFVSGKSNDEAHAWNLVKLDDGKWYWMDLTYDDKPYSEEGKSYVYFAVSANENVNRPWTDYRFDYGAGYTFAENHRVSNETGTHYVPALPSIAAQPYKSCGETDLLTTFTVGDFTYAVEGYKAVRLIQCSIASGDITIPETVSYCGIDYTVQSIGSMKDGRFYNILSVFEGEHIDTLFIPKTVRTIVGGAETVYAKQFCVAEDNESFCSINGVLYTKSLYALVSYPLLSEQRTLTLPDETVQIHHRTLLKPYHFENQYLESITFGERFRIFGVMNVGSGWNDGEVPIPWTIVLVNICRGIPGQMFALFPNLKELTFRNDNYQMKDGLLYQKWVELREKDGVIYHNPELWIMGGFASLTEVTIPAEVNAIATDAFNSHRRLKRVLFEEGSKLIEIQQSAFSCCSALKEIELPEGLEILGNHAFVSCTSLKTMVLPSTLKKIERSVFHGSGMRSLTFAGDFETWETVQKEEEWNYDNREPIPLRFAS